MTIGKTSAPAVLLLPGEELSPEEALSAVKGMGKYYRLLLPVFEDGEGQTALEDALIDQCAGRLWGAYGRGSGAELLLSLIAGGRVRIRTWVTEGAFDPPGTPLLRKGDRGFCWIGAKDKAGKKSLDALRENCPGVRSLTMKKLPKKKSTLVYCPKFAAGRMEKAFGQGVTIMRSAVVDVPADKLWAELCRRPGDLELARLRDISPLDKDESSHVLILEGKADFASLWSHLIRVEPGEDGKSVCTDQIMLCPRGRPGLTAGAAKLFLVYAQLRRAVDAKRRVR